MTSRWTSACGLTSSSATKPSVSATCFPSRKSRQKRQSSVGNQTLLGHRGRPNADERADLAADEPRRVVVAVAATGPVDQHLVLAAELRVPAAAAELGGKRAQARPALLLRVRRNRVALPRLRPRPR